MQQDRIIYRSYPHETITKKTFHSPVHKRLYKSIRIFGASLTSFAMAAYIVSFSPSFSTDFKDTLLGRKESFVPVSGDEVVLTVGSEQENVVTPNIKSNDALEQLDNVFKEAKKWGVDTNFSVVVPAINAKSKVIANVDPWNEEEYKDALKHGVAHAKETSLPDGESTVYLFAHSTDTSFNVARYNAVFYQLKSLQYGDEILIFYNQFIYRYKVVARHVVAADDTSWLQDDQPGRLILQTCDPPGTTWKRLLIIAERV